MSKKSAEPCSNVGVAPFKPPGTTVIRNKKKRSNGSLMELTKVGKQRSSSLPAWVCRRVIVELVEICTLSLSKCPRFGTFEIQSPPPSNFPYYLALFLASPKKKGRKRRAPACRARLGAGRPLRRRGAAFPRNASWAYIRVGGLRRSLVYYNGVAGRISAKSPHYATGRARDKTQERANRPFNQFWNFFA